YFYTKLLVLFSEFFIAIIVCNILASLLWGYSLFYFLTTTILFSLVVLQYLLVVSTISILFSNMLVSIGVTIFYWITSIILVAIGGIFKVSAIFDASNSLYKIIGKLFSHPMTIDLTDFFIIVPYMICLS
ncbi:ABC transporter permease, partial [Streptococcus agalactiae]